MTEVHYYYSAHSAYAYLGAAELYRMCAKHNARLIHKPFALSPVVEQQGSQPFAKRTQAHVDYFFGRELERWAEMRAVPIMRARPTYHDADYSLANGMIAALGMSGEAVDTLSLAILRAHWVDDLDLSDAAGLGHVAAACGHDPQTLLGQAASADIQAICARNTAEASDLNLFGSPTYVVAGDPFYGQDHLVMVERALTNPFTQSQWRNPPVDPA